jgi:hypothetical protein
MEPGKTGTGNVAADQTTAAQPPNQNNQRAAVPAQGKQRNKTHDKASLSPPGNQTTHQTATNKSDGR